MLIDVRSPEEYAANHHDGATNVPLDEVEHRELGIPFDEKITLYCQSGARARLAQMILMQRGFKNAELLNETGEY